MRAQFVNRNPFKEGEKVTFLQSYYEVQKGTGKIVTCIGEMVFVEVSMPDCGTHVVQCHYSNLEGWDRNE